MTTLSTHDTKRGEDVRARITALAEMPERWMHALARLLELAPLPDPGFGSLLWQAAVGAWPISRERLHAYAEKAMREAGDRTTWTAPDAAYEDAVHAAVDAAYDDPRVTALIEELLSQAWWARAGATPSPPSWSRSPCPACPTSTRAASCGSRAWSIPTTGASSTSTPAPASSTRWAVARRHRSRTALTTPAPPSSPSPAPP